MGALGPYLAQSEVFLSQEVGRGGIDLDTCSKCNGP